MAGDNPNLVFYTMRFQNAKNVELYHVSTSKSSLFHIETVTYGKQTFELENHFTSIPHLIEALSHLKNDSGSEVKLDVIVIGSSSLQKLSAFPAAIKSAVTEQTKIFIESTGFIHLEPFVRSSPVFKHASVFSIMTDYDIRRVPSSVSTSSNNNGSNGSNKNSNTYRQFVPIEDAENIRKKYSIYLGTGTNSNAPLSPGSPYQGTKNKSYTHTQARYTSDTVKVLKSFERLFSRLFPLDKIENCDYTYNEFLSKQWNLSLLKICLDPLLIIFEETNTRKLTEHILAKPLISGVITELITVARNMNIRLDSALDNENSMLVTWVEKYNGGSGSGSDEYIPPLVYNFVHRTANLDIDLLLLQPILIADDYGIKTPYLEFMYTVLCQAERLNRGKSVWFTRMENLKSLKQQLSTVTTSKEQLEETCKELSVSLDKKELQLKGVRENEQKLKIKLQELEKQLKTLKEASIETAAAAATTTTTAVTPIPNGQVEMTKRMEMMQLGSRASSNGQMVQPQMLPPVTNNGNPNIIMASNIGNNTSPQKFMDRAHDDRERQLQQRELELQEREADLEKRIQQQQRREQQIQLHVQTQQPPQQMPFNQSIHQSPLMYPNNSFNAMNTPGTSTAATPTTNASVANATAFGLSSGGNMPLMRSRSSVAKLQSIGAPLHGPKMSHGSFSPPISAERFVDPIADGPSGIESPYEIPGARYQGMPYSSHQIKPTSRKYRKSHLPNIGSASSIDMNALAGSTHLNQPGMGAHRISSLPALQANGYPNNNAAAGGGFGGNSAYTANQTSATNLNDTRLKYGSSTAGPDYLNPTRTKKVPTASPVLNASQRQVSSSTLGDTFNINKSNSASTGSTTVDDPSSGISRGVIQFGSAKPVDIGLGVSTSDSQPIKLNSAPYSNQFSNTTPITFNNESPVKEETNTDTNTDRRTDNKLSKKKKKKFSIFNKK